MTTFGDPRTDGHGVFDADDREDIEEEKRRIRNRRQAQREVDEENTEEEGEEDDGWSPVDLGPYLRGEIVIPRPSLGVPRSDGVQLVYPGCEHYFVAETGAGKTWLAVGCAVCALLAGLRVVYIHWEEASPASTVERMLRFGATPEMILGPLFDFVGPKTGLRPKKFKKLLEDPPALVIHDGVNEAMSLIAAKHFEVDGASLFRKLLVAPCTAVGAATLGCDHFPHGQSGGSRVAAFGSVHKGNAMDGARFSLENVEPFGRGMRGRSNLYLTKDRPGHLMQHGRPNPKVPNKVFFGSLIIDSTPRIGEPDHFSFELLAPTDESTARAEQEDVGGLDPLKLSIHGVVLKQPAGRVPSKRRIKALLRDRKVSFTDTQLDDAIEEMLVETPTPRLIEVPSKGTAKAYEAPESAS